MQLERKKSGPSLKQRISSATLKCPAVRGATETGTFTEDRLYKLWRKSCRHDQDAKRELFALVTQHPMLSAVLTRFARGRDMATRGHQNARGTKRKKSKQDFQALPVQKAQELQRRPAGLLVADFPLTDG